MPRLPRRLTDGIPLHIYNRGNKRARIFLEDADYIGFIGALAHAAERSDVRLLTFAVMPNHFHLVVWPVHGDAVPAYMQNVMNAHLRDLTKRHGTSGTGHVYQGRYQSVPVYSDRDLLSLCRYVEANALTAGLVEKAEDWRWCGLSCSGPVEDVNILTPWPCQKPQDWLARVNRPPSNRILSRLRRKAKDGRRQRRRRRT
jgi:putative transposase